MSQQNTKVKLGKDGPDKNYAVPQAMPNRTSAVDIALSNNSYGRQSKSNVDEFETYYIKQKDAYYKGEWLEKLPHGKGIVQYGNGSYYEGHFVKGNAHDQNAFIVLPNGAVFQGNVTNSEVNGKGTLKLASTSSTANSYEYNGAWQNGKPHGYGQEKFGNGSYYKGDFINGLKDGQGTYFNAPDNENYTGSFQEGLFHGKGSFSSKSGTNYNGQFAKGKKDGYGTLTNQFGDLTGQFKNDEVNGQGTFTWKDGRVYSGGFKENQFHGQGKITYKNGQVVKGLWEDGHNKILNSVVKQK